MTTSPSRATVPAPQESVHLMTITRVTPPLRTTVGGTHQGLQHQSTAGTFQDISPCQTCCQAWGGESVQPPQRQPWQNEVRPVKVSLERMEPVLVSRPALRSGTRNTNIHPFLTQIKPHSGNQYTALLMGASPSSEVRQGRGHRQVPPDICISTRQY